MIPGPDQVIACPHCGALARYMTLVSGNTFGARAWTDGHQVAPMLPRPPKVVKCRGCAKYYWRAHARKVGTVPVRDGETTPVDPSWAAAPSIAEPSAADYYAALRQGLADTQQEELDLRVLAWWRGNDAQRGPGAQPPTDHDPEATRGNLQALAGLLDDADENECLMKAEALRELGEFTESDQVLDRVTSPEYAGVVQQLRALCAARRTDVVELQP